MMECIDEILKEKFELILFKKKTIFNFIKRTKRRENRRKKKYKIREIIITQLKYR